MLLLLGGLTAGEIEVALGRAVAAAVAAARAEDRLHVLHERIERGPRRAAEERHHLGAQGRRARARALLRHALGRYAIQGRAVAQPLLQIDERLRRGREDAATGVHDLAVVGRTRVLQRELVGLHGLHQQHRLGVAAVAGEQLRPSVYRLESAQIEVAERLPGRLVGLDVAQTVGGPAHAVLLEDRRDPLAVVGALLERGVLAGRKHDHGVAEHVQAEGVRSTVHAHLGSVSNGAARSHKHQPRATGEDRGCDASHPRSIGVSAETAAPHGLRRARACWRRRPRPPSALRARCRRRSCPTPTRRRGAPSPRAWCRARRR